MFSLVVEVKYQYARARAHWSKQTGSRAFNQSTMLNDLSHKGQQPSNTAKVDLGLHTTFTAPIVPLLHPNSSFPKILPDKSKVDTSSHLVPVLPIMFHIFTVINCTNTQLLIPSPKR